MGRFPRWATIVGMLVVMTAHAAPAPRASASDAGGKPAPALPHERKKAAADSLKGFRDIPPIFVGPGGPGSGQHGEQPQPQLEVQSLPPSLSEMPPPHDGPDTASITPTQAIGYSGYIALIVGLFMYCKPRGKN